MAVRLWTCLWRRLVEQMNERERGIIRSKRMKVWRCHYILIDGPQWNSPSPASVMWEVVRLRKRSGGLEKFPGLRDVIPRD